jgi:hypothetical protein
MVISQSCDVEVSADGGHTVGSGLTDTVTGVLDVGTATAPRISVVDNEPTLDCSFDIYGTTDADLAEADQSLTVSGNGLATADVDCLGIFGDDDPVTLSVAFDVSSADGPLNFTP